MNPYLPLDLEHLSNFPPHHQAVPFYSSGTWLPLASQTPSIVEHHHVDTFLMVETKDVMLQNMVFIKTPIGL